MVEPLTEAYLAALSHPTDTPPDLQSRLVSLLSAAHAAWPTIAVPDDAFAAHLGKHGALENEGRVGELYLTCACARGDAVAIAAFQDRHFGEIDGAGRRTRAGDDVVAEARQNLARSLFSGASPGIGGYSGRGDLGGWMRVTAVREVLRLRERARRDVPVATEAVFDALLPAEDPELAFLKDRYRAEFTEAFHAAVAELSERERTLFRHQLVDGWGIDELAAAHGVHRSTAARWLSGARKVLLDLTRARLKERWGVDSVEVDSIVRLLTSRLDMSLENAVR